MKLIRIFFLITVFTSFWNSGKGQYCQYIVGRLGEYQLCKFADWEVLLRTEEGKISWRRGEGHPMTIVTISAINAEEKDGILYFDSMEERAIVRKKDGGWKHLPGAEFPIPFNDPEYQRFQTLLYEILENRGCIVSVWPP